MVLFPFPKEPNHGAFRSFFQSRVWQQVLEEYRQSNLSVAAFCSQKSLSVQSFYQWRRKLQPDHQVRDVQNLVPVRIITALPRSEVKPQARFIS